MILLLISDQDYRGYNDSLVVTKTNRRHENPLEIRIYSNIIYKEEQNIILGATWPAGMIMVDTSTAKLDLANILKNWN